MKCISCEAVISDESVFCQFCGARQVEPTQPSETSPVILETSRQEPKEAGGKRHWRKYLAIFAGIAAISVAVITYILAANSTEMLIGCFNTTSEAKFSKTVDKLLERGGKAQEPLMKALNNRKPFIRMGAAVTLGKMKSTQAVEKLTNLLYDQDTKVRLSALDALIEIGDPSVAEPIISLLSDPGCDFKNKVISALSSVKDDRCIRPLVGCLADADLVACTSDVLVKFGSKAVQPLIDALEPPTEAAAGNVLVRIGEPAAEKLITALKDSKLEKVKAAVNILGRIKSSEAIRPLLGLLDSENEELRGLAGRALTDIGEPVVLPLIEKLRNPEFRVDTVVDNIFLCIGQPAVKRLIENLKDKDYFIKWYSAVLLSKVDDSPALNSLMESLRNGQLDVVANAYPFFIVKGETGTEDVLVNSFKAYATIDMANDYLNSGNPELEKAVKAWAKENGYTIEESESAHTGPVWHSEGN